MNKSLFQISRAQIQERKVSTVLDGRTALFDVRT